MRLQEKALLQDHVFSQIGSVITFWRLGMSLTYLVVIALAFGTGAIMIGTKHSIAKVGILLMALVPVWAIVIPLVFGFPVLLANRVVWEIVHVLGVFVGGLFTIYMKVLESTRKKENILGILLGVTFTLLWALGLAIFRKAIDL